MISWALRCHVRWQLWVVSKKARSLALCFTAGDGSIVQQLVSLFNLRPYAARAQSLCLLFSNKYARIAIWSRGVQLASGFYCLCWSSPYWCFSSFNNRIKALRMAKNFGCLSSWLVAASASLSFRQLWHRACAASAKLQYASITRRKYQRFDGKLCNPLCSLLFLFCSILMINRWMCVLFKRPISERKLI